MNIEMIKTLDSLEKTKKELAKKHYKSEFSELNRYFQESIMVEMGYEENSGFVNPSFWTDEFFVVSVIERQIFSLRHIFENIDADVFVKIDLKLLNFMYEHNCINNSSVKKFFSFYGAKYEQLMFNAAYKILSDFHFEDNIGDIAKIISSFASQETLEKINEKFREDGSILGIWTKFPKERQTKSMVINFIYPCVTFSAEYFLKSINSKLLKDTEIVIAYANACCGIDNSTILDTLEAVEKAERFIPLSKLQKYCNPALWENPKFVYKVYTNLLAKRQFTKVSAKRFFKKAHTVIMADAQFYANLIELALEK